MRVRPIYVECRDGRWWLIYTHGAPSRRISLFRAWWWRAVRCGGPFYESRKVNAPAAEGGNDGDPMRRGV